MRSRVPIWLVTPVVASGWGVGTANHLFGVFQPFGRGAMRECFRT